MRKIIFLNICLIISSLIPNAHANTFIEKKIDAFTVKAIEYSLDSWEYDLKIGITQEPKTLEEILLENNGVSWVNGIFFCPSDYASCWWKSYTINERYIEWEKVWVYDDTGARVVFAWEKWREPFLFQTWKINADKEKEIYYGLANHPLLLKDWENQLERYYDGGTIDKKMVAKMPRNFICTDTSKKHIYFWYVYSPTIDELVQVLLKFGCSDALNLDAWKSSSYEYNGRVLFDGDRKILDGIVVERIWFDVKSTEKKVENTFIKLYSTIQTSKKYKDKTAILEKIYENISLARKKIYDTNSTDIYDPVSWVKVWYRIDIHKESIFKKVYFLNRLQKYIKLELERLG